MSEPTKPRKAQASLNGDHAVYRERPKIEDTGYIDENKIKAEYLDHEKVAFSHFCEAMGYSTTAMKMRVNYIGWVKEKKHAIAKAKLETLGEKIFEANNQLPINMLESISESATLARLARAALKNKLVNVVRRQQEEKDYTKTQDVYELVALSNAVQGVIKASKEANFMQDVSLKLADDILPKSMGELSQPDPALETEFGVKDGEGTWRVRLIGKENPGGKSAAEIDAMLGVNTDGERPVSDDDEAVPSTDE